MTHKIRVIQENDIDTIVGFAVDAWEPVFASFKTLLGEEIFERLRPNWRQEQARLVHQTCKNKQKFNTFVAEADGKAVGFVAVILNKETLVGEIDLLAVDPAYQGQNIGTELNKYALEFMAAKGMTFAEVGTGGDPGHAPARRSYEKAGFTPLPLMRYYKVLGNS